MLKKNTNFLKGFNSFINRFKKLTSRSVSPNSFEHEEIKIDINSNSEEKSTNSTELTKIYKDANVGEM